jgi:peptide/nickel transport system ATP-binding protein
MLDVKDLSIGFTAPDRQRIQAADGVSFAVAPGEVVGLVGESGSGKSVTCQAVLGLLPHTADVSGSVAIDGREVLGLSARQWSSVRGTSAAIVLQDPFGALNPVLPIGVQLTDAIRANRRVNRKRAREIAVELLRDVGLPDAASLMRRYPHQLSGGMCQRVVIAIALSGEPRYLLADEPTTALDVTVQAQVVELIANLAAQRHMGVLFVTHDLGVVAGLCDRVEVMYAGRIVESATVRDLYAAPRHPYTRALLDSLPARQTRDQITNTTSHPGLSRGSWEEGCAFAGRCARSEPRCGVQTPDLTEPPGGSADSLRRVRCFRPIVPETLGESLCPAK